MEEIGLESVSHGIHGQMLTALRLPMCDPPGVRPLSMLFLTLPWWVPRHKAMVAVWRASEVGRGTAKRSSQRSAQLWPSDARMSANSGRAEAAPESQEQSFANNGRTDKLAMHQQRATASLRKGLLRRRTSQIALQCSPRPENAHAKRQIALQCIPPPARESGGPKTETQYTRRQEKGQDLYIHTQNEEHQHEPWCQRPMQH